VDYLAIYVTIPAPLTVARRWLGDHAKATIVAALPEAAE
jgi:hypothetical protein